ncbi:hypothetical protein ACEZ3G_09895 [Maribacter algicola]|uniref:Uncharacterized protein n=1 Tax=Meishania litoralis TaxID=3434685 RepID=A0ACC7LJP7_9FLAO
MDNFEKHIRENVAEFDEHKADSAKMWANIATELKTEAPKVVPLWKSSWVRMAASVVILLGVAAIIGLSGIGKGSDIETTYVSKELMDIDMHYKGLVSHQVQLVRNHPKLSEDDKAEFLSFMGELDEEYEQLRLEMQKNLDNELVLEAIVSNYKQRIELIEKLLRQINDSKIQDEDYGYTL